MDLVHQVGISDLLSQFDTTLFLSVLICFAALGLLIAKKKVFKNPVPGGCGGGTVLFVS